jgi:phosphohistidine swiveling domain-containing protein
LTQEPIKLTYKQESGDVIYIEQKTGATIGATFDRTTTMSPDTSGLVGAFAIIGKYASDPTVGPAITAAIQAGTQLAGAEPNPVFNQNMTIIENSQATLAESAKEKIPLLSLVNLWIPVIVGVIGALILILGAAVLARRRKAA